MREKDDQIAALLARLESRENEQRTRLQEGEGTSGAQDASSMSMTPEEIRDMISRSIKECHIAQNPPVVGY